MARCRVGRWWWSAGGFSVLSAAGFSGLSAGGFSVLSAALFPARNRCEVVLLEFLA